MRTTLYRWVQPGRENTTENRYTNWYGDTDAQRAKHLLLRSRTPEYVIDYYDYDEYGNRTTSRRLDVRAANDSSLETAYPYIRSEQTLHRRRQLRPDRKGTPAATP